MTPHSYHVQYISHFTGYTHITIDIINSMRRYMYVHVYIYIDSMCYYFEIIYIRAYEIIRLARCFKVLLLRFTMSN